MTKSMRAGEDSVEPTDSPTASPAVSHAQHTPLPWQVSSLDGRTIGPVRVLTASGHDVPQLQAVAVVKERMNESDANAAFIVRACNHHEALLAVIRDLLARFVEFDHASWSEAEIAVRDRALAAINSAEGK